MGSDTLPLKYGEFLTLYNKSIKQSPSELVSEGGVFDDLWNAFKGVFHEVYYNSTSPVRQLYVEMNDRIKAKLSDVANTIKDAVNTSKQAVTDKLVSVQNKIQTTSSNLLLGLKTKLTNVRDIISLAVTSSGSKIVNGIKGKLAEVIASAKATALKTSGALSDWLSKIRDSLEKFPQSVRDGFANFHPTFSLQ